MRKASVLLAAVLVVGTAVGRAEEPVAPLKPVPALPPTEVMASSCASSCKKCDATCSLWHRGLLKSRLCEWLTYRPLPENRVCDCCKKGAPCCHPPLYTYFLSNCVAPSCTGHTAVITWEEPSHAAGGGADMPTLLRNPVVPAVFEGGLGSEAVKDVKAH